MRELTDELKEQVKEIAKQRLGEASDYALKKYTQILLDAWVKGEINLGLEGE